MAHNRKSEKRLDDLYKTLPTLECQGLCQESCGPIAMTPDEFRRISEKSGTIPTIDDEGTCSLLAHDRCLVYEQRPAICRLWGVVEVMKCEFGCVPNPRFLTKDEGFQFLKKIQKATGNKGLKSTMVGFEEML